ncbi:DUF488 family protein [Pontibacillus yanchengensis]|uniref:DUF488 family protein n=2 Tax=Pontibacillus yanchengensis TaxID=462910 RepID=A0ACC7VHM3_9BACI|nr:DUF488 domain-containing protein [Pontibacillus yanchengensis]MYL34610.1 DUF488 family protein [Pontibacillus yanchengensis]MYL54476.1 DUF488 family protein [Pontibacillus yanchengensis]
MSVQLKRIYQDVSNQDGMRILVDGIWPRGVSKEAAQLDEWIKDVAPSSDLRKWFGHDPDKFADFKSKYKQEMDEDEGKKQALDQLKSYVKQQKVTLLFATKEEEYNHAVVLKEILTKQ